MIEIDVYCGECGKVSRVLESEYEKKNAGGCPYCEMYNLRRINPVGSYSPNIPQTLPINKSMEFVCDKE